MNWCSHRIQSEVLFPALSLIFLNFYRYKMPSQREEVKVTENESVEYSYLRLGKRLLTKT
jgi:hypothetical protein